MKLLIFNYARTRESLSCVKGTIAGVVWNGDGRPEGLFPDDRHSVRVDANYQGVITTSTNGSQFAAIVLQDNEWIHGQLSASSRYVHLFINGKYRGIYYPTERPDADFASNHLGCDAYMSIQQLVDIDSFIDEIVLRIWIGDCWAMEQSIEQRLGTHHRCLE